MKRQIFWVSAPRNVKNTPVINYPLHEMFHPIGNTRLVMSSRTAGYIAHSCEEWYRSMKRFSICITCCRLGFGSDGSFSTSVIVLLEISYSRGIVMDCGSWGTWRPILVSWSWNVENQMSHIMRKPVFTGFRPGKTQTSLLSYRDKPETWNFGFARIGITLSLKAANNKGTDQTARMRRLICAFVVRIRHKQVFSWRGSNVRRIRINSKLCFTVKQGPDIYRVHTRQGNVREIKKNSRSGNCQGILWSIRRKWNFVKMSGNFTFQSCDCLDGRSRCTFLD